MFTVAGKLNSNNSTRKRPRGSTHSPADDTSPKTGTRHTTSPSRHGGPRRTPQQWEEWSIIASVKLIYEIERKGSDTMASEAKRQKTAIIYVRVKPEVKAMLEAQAKAQGRSLTNYLEWLALVHGQQEQQHRPAEV